MVPLFGYVPEIGHQLVAGADTSGFGPEAVFMSLGTTRPGPVGASVTLL